jgi:hypothetical protein
VNIPKTKRATVFIVFLVLSLVGGVLVYYGTHWGPWTDDDSAEYFEAARNLATGRGLVLVRASGAVRPLSSRPPFYSVILSIGPSIGVDIFTFARWLDIFLFGGFLLLLGFFAYHLLGHLLLSCILVVLFLVSPAFLSSFTSGLAEPIFFVLGISCFFLLISYLQTGQRLALVGSSVLAGLSLLTRLSGVAIVGAGIIGLVVFNSRRLSRRIKDAFVFGLVSVLMMVPWLYTVYSGGETAGIYQFNFDNLWYQLEPVRKGFVDYGWRLLPYSAYLPELSYRAKLGLLVIVGLVPLVLLGVALRRNRGARIMMWRQDPFLQVVGIFSFFTLAYVFVFLFSYLFMHIPRALLIDRHLSPIELGAVVALFTLGMYLIEAFHWPRWTTVLPVILALGMVIPNVQAGSELLSDLHDEGKGHTRAYWHQSELMEALKELPQDVPLISNETEAIILWADRRAYRIPELWNRTYVEPFTPFGADPDDPVQEIFRDQGAALVLFNTVYWQFWVIYAGKADERWEAFVDGLYPYVKVADGTIYFYEAHPGGR